MELSEEEKKAIEILKSVRISLMNFNEVTEENKKVIASIQTIVNLIENQQKEIERKNKLIEKNRIALKDCLKYKSEEDYE